MLNFTQPLSYQDLAAIPAEEILLAVRGFCALGKGMHPESLKAVVLRLTRLSREMNLTQTARDEAAEMASLLANAALKTYGRHSNFSMDLLASIEAIAGRSAA